MVQIVRSGDAAPQAVVRVHGEGHVHLAFDHGEARVVRPADLIILHGENRLFLHLPAEPVLAEGQADIRAGKGGVADIAIVVAEHHGVPVFPGDHPGVEHKIAGIGHLAAAKNGVAAVSGDAGVGRKLNIVHTDSVLPFAPADGFFHSRKQSRVLHRKNLILLSPLLYQRRPVKSTVDKRFHFMLCKKYSYGFRISHCFCGADVVYFYTGICLPIYGSLFYAPSVSQRETKRGKKLPP